MKNAKLLLQGLRELQKLSPRLLMWSSLRTVCSVLRPLLMVICLSYAVDVVLAKDTRGLKVLACIIAAEVLLFVAEQIFTSVFESRENLLYINEQQAISQMLVKMPYSDFSDKSFQEKIAAHKNIQTQQGSAFRGLIELIDAWVKGLLTIVIALALLAPFFKSIFSGDLKASIALIACLLICGVSIIILSSIANRKTYILRKQYISANRMFRYYSELLSQPKNGKEIRIYSAQNLILDQATNEIANRGLETEKRIIRTNANYGVFYALIGALMGAAGYIFLGYKGLVGALGIAEIVRYLGAAMQVIQAITLLGEITGRMNFIAPNLNYYFDVITAASQSNTESKKKLENRPPVIEFKNVSFRYPGAQTDIFKNLSLKINSEETLAIVGENGSGKTTLVNLLCRFYEPHEGQILLNGTDIREYDIDEYQAMLSAVFQDFTLFARPVGENIACSTDFDSDKISELTYIEPAKNAKALSGGEAQKIAIARALHRDSPIVIFDEPTASLDPISERDVYRNFSAKTKGKTAIYISHRLTSCRFCQRILVFDKGQIAENGSHEELLAQNGKYAKLWKTQAKLYYQSEESDI